MKNGVLSILFGLLATASSQAVVIFADSQTDFSNTQGYQGWEYGHYGWGASDDAFTPYNTYGIGTGDWANSWNDNGSPGNGFLTDYLAYAVPNTNGDVVRRWVSDTSGVVSISGLVQRLENGDHTARFRIFINGSNNGLLSLDVGATDLTEYSYAFTNIPLAVGDNVDFVLDYPGNTGSVLTTFTGEVATVPEPGMLVLLAVGGLAVIQRRRA